MYGDELIQAFEETFNIFVDLLSSSAVRSFFLILIFIVIWYNAIKTFKSICCPRRSWPKEDSNGLVKEVQQLDQSLDQVEKNLDSFSEKESLLSERDGCVFFDGDCSKCNYCHDCHIVEDLKKWTA